MFGKKDKKKPKASLEMLTEKVIGLEDRFNNLVAILQTHSPALQLYFAELELRKLKQKVEEQAVAKPPLEDIEDGKVSEEAKQVLRI